MRMEWSGEYCDWCTLNPEMSGVSWNGIWENANVDDAASAVAKEMESFIAAWPLGCANVALWVVPDEG